MSSGLGISFNIFVVYAVLWTVGYFIWAVRREK